MILRGLNRSAKVIQEELMDLMTLCVNTLKLDHDCSDKIPRQTKGTLLIGVHALYFGIFLVTSLINGTMGQ